MFVGFSIYCSGIAVVCIIINALAFFVVFGDRILTYFASRTIHHGVSREEAGLQSKEEVDELIAKGKLKTTYYD